jgi:hypothetical protein
MHPQTSLEHLQLRRFSYLISPKLFQVFCSLVVRGLLHWLKFFTLIWLAEVVFSFWLGMGVSHQKRSMTKFFRFAFYLWFRMWVSYLNGWMIFITYFAIINFFLHKCVGSLLLLLILRLLFYYIFVAIKLVTIIISRVFVSCTWLIFFWNGLLRVSFLHRLLGFCIIWTDILIRSIFGAIWRRLGYGVTIRILGLIFRSILSVIIHLVKLKYLPSFQIFLRLWYYWLNKFRYFCDIFLMCSILDMSLSHIDLLIFIIL